MKKYILIQINGYLCFLTEEQNIDGYVFNTLEEAVAKAQADVNYYKGGKIKPIKVEKVKTEKKPVTNFYLCNESEGMIIVEIEI